jgi:heterodisulfide reductase subunit C
MEATITRETLRNSFVKEIEAISGENANLCFQCMKCTTGCPVSAYMDYQPAQIIHAIRLGQEELVMQSATPWLCASCQTCTTRCPQGVDIAGLMDAVRILAQRRGVVSGEDVKAFYDAALGSICKHGRMKEAAMMIAMKGGLLMAPFRTSKEDRRLGITMARKGKLSIRDALFPSKEGADQTQKIFKNVKEIEAADEAARKGQAQ